MGAADRSSRGRDTATLVFSDRARNEFSSQPPGIQIRNRSLLRECNQALKRTVDWLRGFLDSLSTGLTPTPESFIAMGAAVATRSKWSSILLDNKDFPQAVHQDLRMWLNYHADRIRNLRDTSDPLTNARNTAPILIDDFELLIARIDSWIEDLETMMPSLLDLPSRPSLRVDSVLGAKHFVLADESATLPTLTPYYLGAHVVPYLTAIADLQHLMVEVRAGIAQPVVINWLARGSIDVSLNGAAEAIEAIKDFIVPWRRHHHERLARLAEDEKQAEIETKRAEVLSIRATADREREEAKIKRAEAEKLLAEAEKLRQEIHFERVRLALEVIKQIAPDMPDEMKITYVVKLLEPLKLLTESPLTVADDASSDAA